MVNRGDGGGKRPVPPAARPAPRAPAKPADDGEEKTSAINLADVNLDDLDAPSAPPKKPVPPPRKPAIVEDEEKTNAINLADVNLDDLDAVPARPAPQARPQPGRPAPPSRPAAPPPRAAASVPDDDEKTGAISSVDAAKQLEALRQRRAAAAAPAPAAKAPEPARPVPSRPAPAPAPAPAPVPPKPAPRAEPPPRKEEVIEKTMAVSLDDFEAKLKPGPKPGPKSGKPDPAAADRTYVVDDEEPAAPPPQPKRMPAALAAKAAEKAAPAKPDPKEAAEGESKFVVRAGPDQGKTFPLTKDLTLVGRGLDADIVINDASASRKHFNVVRTLSGWKLVDLGSGNGTKIDGTKVSEIALKQGMRIELGATSLEFVSNEASAASEPKKIPKAEAAAEPVVAAPRGTLTDEAKGPEKKRRSPPAAVKEEDPELEELKRSAKRDPAEAEKTSFGDVESLQIDPEWEARRQKQRREGSGTSEVEAADIEAPRSSGVGKKLAIAGLVVGVLGGGFVAADKFAGLGIIFPKAAPTATAGKDGGDKDGDGSSKPPKEAKGADEQQGKGNDGDKKSNARDAKVKVEAGDQAVKNGRLLEALVAYKAAIELDSGADGAEGGVALVEDELQRVAILVKAIGLQGELKYAEAALALDELKEGAAIRPWADKLIAATAQETDVALLKTAFEALDKGDAAVAKARFEKALKLAKADLETSTIKPVVDAFKDALVRAAAADAGMADADPKTKAEVIDLKPAFAAYAKGDMAAALNGFDSLQDPAKKASKADVGKATAASAVTMLVDELMKAAADPALKADNALSILRTVRLADAHLGGLQAARIDALYAKAIAPTAKQAVDAKELHRAVVVARMILAVPAVDAAAATEAKAVVAAVAEAGKKMLAEAKSSSKSDPDKALKLALEAMPLFGSADPELGEAQKLIKGLTASE